MNCRQPIRLLFFVYLLSLLALAPVRAGAITHIIDPAQQLALPFPERSHWLQPWRAYLDTRPTTALRDAVGINLNVDPSEVEAVCEHLAQNGFRHVRIEFGWGSVSWDHPDQLADPARFDRMLVACKRNGLRPLLLLNAHSGDPCPARFFSVHLIRPAHRGDRTLQIDPAEIPALVPGRSGLCDLTDYWAAEVIFTQTAPNGTVTLSRPLPKDLPAGPAKAATLKFLPFYPSRLADGTVPAEFTETMEGWLQYVQAITTEAKRALGTEGAADAGFDLEVWNELTFGSHFLDINDYYSPALVHGQRALDEILSRTVAYVVDPQHHLAGVGVGDGFNNQWPWGAGSTAPPGLAALDKHPYEGARRFPEDAGPNNQRPVNALGQPEGVEVQPGEWKDNFTPHYTSFFPEYYLTAIQGETLIRDLSPYTTSIGNVEHGRNTHPLWPDGRPAPAPGMWVTEVNLDPAGAQSIAAAGGSVRFTAADADHLKAKAVLRYLVSFVNKGVGRIYFFAAKDANPMGLGLVSRSFFDTVKSHNGAAPLANVPVPSPAMLVVRRLVAQMPAAVSHHPRSLSLVRIEEPKAEVQFAGDPATPGLKPNPHPPLYDRDVVAFFPFQASDRSFVIPVYVMTRSLAQLYRPNAPAGDVTRFDMPEETFTLTIGGVRKAQVSLYDPLQDRTVPVHARQTTSGDLAVTLPLTDSPRLLRIREAARG